MQFQVPQFIETEDKIVGPFTIKQFLYFAAGGFVSFLLYFILQLWLWAILTVLLAVVSIGLAFIKIEGRPLSHVIFAALLFIWKPQTYVWQPENLQIKKTDGLAKESRTTLEDIVSGAALRRVWQNVQTGTGSKLSGKQFLARTQDRYQIFRKMSGERRAAKRIDYR